jgi:hypothetical protein
MACRHPHMSLEWMVSPECIWQVNVMTCSCTLDHEDEYKQMHQATNETTMHHFICMSAVITHLS